MKRTWTYSLALLCVLSGAAWADNAETAETLREAMIRSTEPVTLEPTLYPGKGATEAAPKPLCVIFASKNFPAGSRDYWVQTFYQAGCPTLVLKLPATQPDSRWADAPVREVLKQVARVPKQLGADPEKMIVLADEATAPLAYRMVNGVNTRLAGLVLVSAKPMVRSRNALAIPWRPAGKEWLVPMWIVCGTREKDAGVRLVLWRKFAAAAPDAASITIDARPARGLGSLLPGAHFPSWLKVIAAGKRPGVGADAQALMEKKTYATLAKLMITALRNNQPVAAGKIISKQEGPLAMSLAPPQGWVRVQRMEREYNPKGEAFDPQGRLTPVEANPYSEVYICPERNRTCFSRVFVRKWTGTAEELLKNTDKRLGSKGYLVVPLGQVKQGDWIYQPTVVLQLYGNKWHRWFTLMAAKGGSKTNPAGAVVMLMDASGTPETHTMASSLKCITQNLKTDATGK